MKRLPLNYYYGEAPPLSDISVYIVKMYEYSWLPINRRQKCVYGVVLFRQTGDFLFYSATFKGKRISGHLQ